MSFDPIASSSAVDDESRNDDQDLRSKKRKQAEIEKLDLKSKECDVKRKELETKKRIRDITYELLDKAVDRLSALCPDGVVERDVEATLKMVYRQMIEDI